MKRIPAEILEEYGPFLGVEAVHGVSFDGRDVWFATGEGVTALDPESGRTSRTLAVPAGAGTAFDGRYLFQIAGAVIRRIDPETGEVLGAIPAPGEAGDNSGLAWAEGSLWVGQHRGCRIHEIDPDTGEVRRTIRSDRFVTGVTWVDGELWHGTWQDDGSDIRHIDPRSGEVLTRLEMPEGTGVSGLEADGGRFFCGGGRSGTIRTVRRPAKAGSS
jgi:streptogramin lyase